MTGQLLRQLYSLSKTVSNIGLEKNAAVDLAAKLLYKIGTSFVEYCWYKLSSFFCYFCKYDLFATALLAPFFALADLYSSTLLTRFFLLP